MLIRRRRRFRPCLRRLGRHRRVEANVKAMSNATGEGQISAVPSTCPVPCQNSVPAGRWGDRHESQGAQCPSYSLCWVLFARRSEPAPTSHSRTWRSGSSSPCSAADRSDRNSGYSIAPSGCGREFRRRVKGMCIAEVLSSSRSPWQNPFAERVIGTLRRELLDHVIVLSEGHLRRRLHSYLRYYHGSRTHLSLEKDAPQPRAVEPPELGRVVALPHVGGLHHRYVRRAA